MLQNHLIALVVAMLASCASATAAFAEQSYPNKPIKIIAPVQPGGGVDLVARQVGERLTKVLGQPVVVENQSGGGGIIASQATARAEPDGYTLMVGYVGTHGTNPAVRKLHYDAVKDFTPIAMVGGTPNLLTVHPSVPPNDLKGFLDFAKKDPKKLNWGTGGIGLLNHLALEQFRAAARLEEVSYVHYRGIGPALADEVKGQINVLMPGLAAALPHIRAKRIKPIAITGLKRHPLQPDVPTFEELGFPGFDAVQWYSIVGPAKLPAEVTKKLDAEINRAIGSPEPQSR